MKKGILLAFSLLLITNLGFSQSNSELKKCKMNEALEELYERYPELEAENEHMQHLLQNNQTVNYNPYSKSNDTSFIIPVVFHIMHMYGNENVSDVQVLNTIDRMNEQYHFDTDDSLTIEPVFKQLAAQSAADITFRLATIDPFGNCTNGIEHIYSHETYIGDQFSKIGQWDRSHYLNIWVTQTVEGAAAYSHYPSATDGLSFWIDGIMTNYTTVNGISGTLTHEAGHWMNLSHTWGNTNDPGVQCGDDGVEDTPITMGNSFNCPTNYQNCDTIAENVSNYMNYASCENMFTPGQVDRMYNALLGISGQRNILWQDTTLLLTGTDSATYANPLPVCNPVADFHAFDKHLCVGASTTFEDHSWNAAISSREWTFEDGSPATSTSPTAVVSFSTPGWKEVTLTVYNSEGVSDTRTESSYIYVSPDWADFEGPALLNVEGNQHYLFLVDNPEDNYAKFNVMDGVGVDGSRAFKLNNYKDISQADPFTADGWYNDRLGKGLDYLITPSFELRYTTGITVTFDYSYASNASVVNDIDEILKVYSSRNCGETWVARKTITGASLVTGGFAGNSDFTPTANNQWETASFNYTATSLDVKTRFMFEFEASDLASNLYIDNIWVDGVLLVEPSQINDLDLMVYPNPTNGDAINVEYTALDEAVTFTLRDMSGKVISTEVVAEMNTPVKHQLEGSSSLPAACYFLEVTSGDYSVTKKVVVL